MDFYNLKKDICISSTPRKKGKILTYTIGTLVWHTNSRDTLERLLSQVHIVHIGGTEYTRKQILSFPIPGEDPLQKYIKVTSTITDLSHTEQGLWLEYVGQALTVSDSLGVQETITQDFKYLVPTHLQMDKETVSGIIKLALKSQYKTSRVEGSIQADAHPTNADLDKAIWIGMTLSVLAQDRAFIIPAFLVGGDIGCGLTAIPLVNNAGKLFNIGSMSDKEQNRFMLRFIRTCQTKLRRGNAVEKGEISKYESFKSEHLQKILRDVSLFATGTDLDSFLLSVYDIITSLNLIKASKRDTDTALRYIVAFMGSLGSSGNHFYEILKDSEGNLISCIHSGSRGFGAKAYEAMKTKLPMLEGDNCIAVNFEDVCLVSHIYDVLNKFALFNRAFCYHLVIEAMSSWYDLTTNVSSILGAYPRLPYIREMGVTEALQEDAIRILAQGIIHNGITALGHTSNGTQYYSVVVQKGSVVLRPKSIAIVANDCCSSTPGCTIVTNSHTGVVENVNISTVFTAIVNGTATLVPIHSPIFGEQGVVSLPHGAGRDVSATKTRQSTKFSDFCSVIERLKGWSISPDTAGDCPGGKAYRSQNLSAYTSSYIKMYGLITLGNFKEGINMQGIPKYIDFLYEFYDMYHDALVSVMEAVTKGASFDSLDEETYYLVKFMLSWDLILVCTNKKVPRSSTDEKYAFLVKAKEVLNGLII